MSRSLMGSIFRREFEGVGNPSWPCAGSARNRL